MTIGETISKAGRDSGKKNPKEAKPIKLPDMLFVSALGIEQIPRRRKETVIFDSKK